MKRIVLLITVIFSGLALSACDMIPTDALPDDIIDQVSEELCREDPDNELCQIEDLSTISETVAEELVLEAVTTINAGDATLCDSVFAVTNTALLDACKDGSLLPAGVESFTVISYEQVGSEYVFKGSTAENAFLEVRMTLGEVEGNTRITSFTTTTIEDPSEPMEEMDVSLEEFETFFQQFIADYLDSTVSDDDFQATYFEEEQNADFYEERALNQAEGTSIVYISAEEKEANLFVVTLDFNYSEDSERETVEVRVNRIEMALKLSFDGEDQDCNGDTIECTPDDYLIGEEAVAFLEQYFIDYTDDTITNDAFSNMYFDGYLSEQFETERNKDLADNASITLIDVIFYEDGSFEAEYEVAVGDDYVLRKRPGRIRKRPDLLTAEWDELLDEHLETNLDTVTTFFTDFVSSYLDSTKTNQDIIQAFFGNMDTPWLLEERDEDLASGLSIEVNMVEPYDQYGYFLAKLTLTNGTETRQEELVFMVSYIEDNVPVLYIMDGEDNDCDGDAIECPIDDSLVGEEAVAFLQKYFADYTNKEITNEEFSNMYFDGYMSEIFETERNKDLTDNAMITLIDVMFYDDGSFEVEYEVAVGDDYYLRKRPGRIRKQENLLIVEWFEFYDERVEMNLDTVTTFFNSFVAAYLDPTKTQQDLEMDFFANMDMTWFLEQRDDELARGLNVEVNMVESYDEYGLFLAKLTITDGMESYQEEMFFVMSYMPDDVPVLHIVDMNGEDNDCDYIGDTCEVVIDPDMAYSYMNEFLTQFNNPDVPTDQLYNLVINFFPLLDTRDEDLANQIIWTLDNTVEPLEDNYFLFYFRASHTSGELTLEIPARLYHTGSMVYIKSMEHGGGDCILTTNVCHFITIVDDGDMLTEIFQMYLSDLTNPDMSLDMIAEYYFMGNLPEQAKKGYDAYMANSASLSHVSTVPAADYPGFFDVTYAVTTATGTTEETVLISLWMKDGYMVFEFYDDTNECHIDPYMCSMPNMYEPDIDTINLFLEDLFQKLNDTTVSDDMIQEYFGWMAPEAILASRDNGNSGAVFVFERVVAPDETMMDPYYEVIYTTTLPGQEPVSESFFARFYEMDMGLFIEVMVDQK